MVIVRSSASAGGVSAHACPVKLVRCVLGITAQVAVLKVAADGGWAVAVVEGNVIQGHVTGEAVGHDALKDNLSLCGRVLAEED